VEVSVGRQFYSSAIAPVQAMHDLLARKNIALALDAVQCQHLTAACEGAVDVVARDAGASRAAVRDLLPAAEARAAAEASADSQQRAVAVWGQHENELTGVVVRGLGWLADSHLGPLGGFGLGGVLLSRVGDFFRDTRLDGPLKELAGALQVYDEVLNRCGAILDADQSLRAGGPRGTRRAARWAVVALAVAAGGAVATAIWARSTNATTNAGIPPPAVSVSITPEPPPAPTLLAPLPPAVVPPAAVTKRSPAQRPAASAPMSRAACLQACVAKCNDNASCERSCAATCPH
jgi:hypothetical protein